MKNFDSAIKLPNKSLCLQLNQQNKIFQSSKLSDFAIILIKTGNGYQMKICGKMRKRGKEIER